MRLAAYILVVPLLTGCLYPHTTRRSSEVYGRILDARTHAPVQDAKVFLTEHPKVLCTSDAAGRFRLKETHNFVLLVGFGDGPGWPGGDYWWPNITVSRTNYVEQKIGGDFPDKGDIFLVPELELIS